MLTHRAGSSYSGRHAERQQRERGASPAEPERLLTDRGSYITYLESQLERVTATCLTVSSFEGRLAAAEAAVRGAEGRVQSAARLAACTQQYAEEGEELRRRGDEALGARLARVEARLEALAAPPPQAAEWEARLSQLSSRLDARVQELSTSTEARLAAAEASLAARLRGVEDAACHLASSHAGVKQTLAGLEEGLASLRAALVAVELRPHGADSGSGAAPSCGGGGAAGASSGEWLARAQGTLRREAAGLAAKEVELQGAMHGLMAAAEAGAPSSPRHALAAQVLGDAQAALTAEVGAELRALRSADRFIGTVAGQLQPPGAPGSGAGKPGGEDEASPAPAKPSLNRGEAAGAAGSEDWAIAAPRPAAERVQQHAAGPAPAPSGGLAGTLSEVAVLLASMRGLLEGGGGGRAPGRSSKEARPGEYLSARYLADRRKSSGSAVPAAAAQLSPPAAAKPAQMAPAAMQAESVVSPQALAARRGRLQQLYAELGADLAAS